MLNKRQLCNLSFPVNAPSVSLKYNRIFSSPSEHYVNINDFYEEKSSVPHELMKSQSNFSSHLIPEDTYSFCNVKIESEGSGLTETCVLLSEKNPSILNGFSAALRVDQCGIVDEPRVAEALRPPRQTGH